MDSSKSPLSPKVKFDAILFDVIGTIVVEQQDVVSSSFLAAFSHYGISCDPAAIAAQRGLDKHSMIRNVCKQQGVDPQLVPSIYSVFVDQLKARAGALQLRPEVPDLFRYLKENGILIGIGTGLARDVFDVIVRAVALDRSLIAFTGTSSDVNMARPDPEMITLMMKILSIQDGSRLLKIGDTVSDIREGKNAGVKTAALLAGTQKEELLRDGAPDFILQRLDDVRSLIF